MAQSNKDSESKKMISTDEIVEIQNDTIRPLFSKEQIEAKLKHLATTPPPTELSYGAMCYTTTMISGTILYICPVCGNKTVYNNKLGKDEEIVSFLWRGLDACRREIQKIKGITVSLHEWGFCKHCTPNVSTPTLYLFVNIGNSKTVKTPDITYMDIRLIHEFLSGSLVHKTSNDGEEPLINYMERIKELLGIKDKPKKND